MFRRKQKENKEFIPTRQEIKETSKLTAKDLLGGKVLSREIVIRQIPFLVFIAVLLLFYIANIYKGERIMGEIISLEKEVRELRAEYSSTVFDRQQLSTQSEILKMINEKGLPLMEAKTPPFKIVMKDQN
jgi:hypothetical protein